MQSLIKKSKKSKKILDDLSIAGILLYLTCLVISLSNTFFVNFEGGLQGSVFQNNIVNHIFVMTSKMFFSIWKITHVVVCLLILQILWSHVTKEKFTKQSANQLTRKKKNKSKGESSIICKNINNLNIKSKVSRTALDNKFFQKV